MNRIPFEAALAALICFGVVSPALAVSAEEMRLLGSDRDEWQYQSYLPFTRVSGVAGVVSGSLAESTAEAGVPPAAMVDQAINDGSDHDAEPAVDLAAKVENLERALLTRSMIGQAMGVLMERHKITAEEAFRILRTASSVTCSAGSSNPPRHACCASPAQRRCWELWVFWSPTAAGASAS